MMEKVFRIREELAWRKMKDGTVTIVSPIIDKIITINQTAGMIWEMLDGANSVQNIVDKMTASFNESETTRTVVENDTLEIISDFNERQLLDEIVDKH